MPNQLQDDEDAFERARRIARERHIRIDLDEWAIRMSASDPQNPYTETWSEWRLVPSQIGSVSVEEQESNLGRRERRVIPNTASYWFAYNPWNGSWIPSSDVIPTCEGCGSEKFEEFMNIKLCDKCKELLEKQLKEAENDTTNRPENDEKDLSG